MAFLTVKPGQDQYDTGTHAQCDRCTLDDKARPAKVIRNKAQHLQEQPGTSQVSHNPLGDLALLQMSYE